MVQSIGLYASDSLLRRQPCVPSASRSSIPGAAAAAASKIGRARASRGPQPAQASLAQHEPDFMQPYHAPDWHPQLHTRFRGGKRLALASVVREFYDEVWNNECVELVEELAAPGICYADALGQDDDWFGVAGLQQSISDFQSAHPLLRYKVEDVIVDEERDTVVAHYSVTAAHLLPSREGAPATGHVSSVQGMDKFKFDRFCHITSIQSYRQRFLDEEVQMIDWDTV